MQPAQVQGACRNGTDRKRILFLSVGLEGFSGSVGSDGEWFSMNREPKCSKWGLRGCLVFRTIRQGNYEKWFWSTDSYRGKKTRDCHVLSLLHTYPPCLFIRSWGYCVWAAIGSFHHFLPGDGWESGNDLPWEVLLSRFTNTEGRLKEKALLLALGVEAAFVMCLCSPKHWFLNLTLGWIWKGDEV